MTGAPALPAPLPVQRTLLSGARALGGAWGATLELSILLICLPWEALAIELQRIDWERGYVPVPLRGGLGMRALVLSTDAQKAILRIAGEVAGRGQAATAGRGPRLQAKLFRLDRLLDRLAEAAPETIQLPEWNFHGLRVGAEGELRRAGASEPEIAAVFGRTGGEVSRGVRGDVELARLALERWSRLLSHARC